MTSIAVLLPCYNEATAIAQTIAAFRHALPTATVYVYDNNSTDDTRAVARAAGAVVQSERMQGKGNVVRRMFAATSMPTSTCLPMATRPMTPQPRRRWSRN